MNQFVWNFKFCISWSKNINEKKIATLIHFRFFNLFSKSEQPFGNNFEKILFRSQKTNFLLGTILHFVFAVKKAIDRLGTPRISW